MFLYQLGPVKAWTRHQWFCQKIYSVFRYSRRLNSWDFQCRSSCQTFLRHFMCILFSVHWFPLLYYLSFSLTFLNGILVLREHFWNPWFLPLSFLWVLLLTDWWHVPLAWLRPNYRSEKNIKHLNFHLNLGFAYFWLIFHLKLSLFNDFHRFVDKQVGSLPKLPFSCFECHSNNQQHPVIHFNLDPPSTICHNFPNGSEFQVFHRVNC